MSVIDKIKLDGTTYDVGKTPDTTLAVSGSPADAAKVGTELDKKVDKVTGKGLSTEDFTTAEKTKLAGIAEGATNIVIDPTLTQSGHAADAKAVGDKIDSLKSAIVNYSELYVDGETVISPKYLNKNSSGGKPTSNSNIRLISEPATMPPKSTGTITKSAGTTSVVVYRFDETDTLLGSVYAGAPGTETPFDHCDHIRVAALYSNNDPITPNDGLEIATVKYYYVSPDTERISALENRAISKVVGKNLVDISASTPGVFITNKNGDTDDSATYDTSEFIPVQHNAVVFSTKIRKLLEYDSNKAAIPTTYVTNEQAAGYVFTPTENTAFFRVSYYHADSSVFMAEYGTVPTAYEPYMFKVEEGIHLSATMLSDIKNHWNENDVLYGKKWVACGDSFTQGGFEYATFPYTIESGIYAGKNKVYPYLIGNRTGMVVVNEAISGSTMTHIDGRTNAFSDTRYQNIPDADYITLKFGINDDSTHQNVPIGTIDDATNDTFYGAWNVVLDYLIRNHLDTKIGIIITNGSTLDIVNATIAIAEKWGIPYLNEATGEQCSFVFRSNRTNIPSGIRNAKNNNWYVSTTEGQVNHHPNVKAHEFESTVVEAWLRTL